MFKGAFPPRCTCNLTNLLPVLKRKESLHKCTERRCFGLSTTPWVLLGNVSSCLRSGNNFQPFRRRKKQVKHSLRKQSFLPDQRQESVPTAWSNHGTCWQLQSSWSSSSIHFHPRCHRAVTERCQLPQHKAGNPQHPGEQPGYESALPQL